MIFFFNFRLKNCITNLFFHLPSNFVYTNFRKNRGYIDVFFVNQLENNDISGNKESAM